MSILNIILLTLSTIFILGALTFFVVALVVGKDMEKWN